MQERSPMNRIRTPASRMMRPKPTSRMPTQSTNKAPRLADRLRLASTRLPGRGTKQSAKPPTGAALPRARRSRMRLRNRRKSPMQSLPSPIFRTMTRISRLSPSGKRTRKSAKSCVRMMSGASRASAHPKHAKLLAHGRLGRTPRGEPFPITTMSLARPASL